LIKSSPTFKSLIFDLSLLSEIAVIDVTCALSVAIDVLPNVISLVAVADEGCAPLPNIVKFEPVVTVEPAVNPSDVLQIPVVLFTRPSYPIVVFLQPVVVYLKHIYQQHILPTCCITK